MKEENKKDENRPVSIPDWLKAVYIPFHPTVDINSFSQLIAQNTGVPPEKVQETIVHLEQAIIELLKQGKPVKLEGIGTFFQVKQAGEDEAHAEFETRFEPSEALLKRLKDRIIRNASLN